MYRNILLYAAILLIIFSGVAYVTNTQDNSISGHSGKQPNNFFPPSRSTLISPSIKNKVMMGAYNPDNIHLNWMQGSEQKAAISAFVGQGFHKYFFVMTDFKNEDQVKSTEKLLDAVDNNNNNINTQTTMLKIIIILLPPSEGGSTTNYDWTGWVSYFNELKGRHPSSFDGFAIDDFNWVSDRNDTKFRRNIDFMLYSNLSQALEGKRDDLNFYPVVYFEGWRTDVVASEYAKYAKSIILGSTNYYNISNVENNLSKSREMFGNKSIEYVVYPISTVWYRNQGYNPPSDRLVMATLSIATRMADGIIVVHKIESHVIQDYLQYREDPDYLQAIHTMEQLQIADEMR